MAHPERTYNFTFRYDFYSTNKLQGQGHFKSKNQKVMVWRSTGEISKGMGKSTRIFSWRFNGDLIFDLKHDPEIHFSWA